MGSKHEMEGGGVVRGYRKIEWENFSWDSFAGACSKRRCENYAK